MSPLLCHNGAFFAEENFKILLTNRGFLYGEGLFETFRAYPLQNGNQAKTCFFPFLKQHLARLRQSAKILGLPLPYSDLEIETWFQMLCDQNGLHEAVLRIYLSACGTEIGDIDTPPKQIDLLLVTKPFRAYPSAFYQSGGRLMINDKIQSESILSHFKSLSYLGRLLVRREAIAAGATDGLMLNANGNLTEGSGSNLFIVKNQKLYTPALHCGLLPGVTRNQVLSLAEQADLIEKSSNDSGGSEKTQNPGEATLTREDLVNADEIFITSSHKELLPISSILGLKKQWKTPGPITRFLHEAYRQRIVEMSTQR